MDKARLVQEDDMYRCYYGNMKGGLVDSDTCINMTDECMVLDSAVVKKGAWISGNAVVKDDAVIEHGVHIGQDAVVKKGCHFVGSMDIFAHDFAGARQRPKMYISNLELEVSSELYLRMRCSTIFHVAIELRLVNTCSGIQKTLCAEDLITAIYTTKNKEHGNVLCVKIGVDIPKTEGWKRVRGTFPEVASKLASIIGKQVRI